MLVLILLVMCLVISDAFADFGKGYSNLKPSALYTRSGELFFLIICSIEEDSRSQKYMNIKLISPDAEIAMIVFFFFFFVVVSLKKEKKEEPVPVTFVCSQNCNNNGQQQKCVVRFWC